MCWDSNPLPSGLGPATSSTGPGRTPFHPGDGRLDHPGAPGTGAPLCCGVRDPLGLHHHLSPFCVGRVGPRRLPGRPFSLCYGVGGLCPLGTHLFPTFGRPSGLSLPSWAPGDRSPPTPDLWEASCSENGRCKARCSRLGPVETCTDVSQDFSQVFDLVSPICFGRSIELETADFLS